MYISVVADICKEQRKRRIDNILEQTCDHSLQRRLLTNKEFKLDHFKRIIFYGAETW